MEEGGTGQDGSQTRNTGISQPEVRAAAGKVTDAATSGLKVSHINLTTILPYFSGIQTYYPCVFDLAGIIWRYCVETLHLLPITIPLLNHQI